MEDEHRITEEMLVQGVADVEGIPPSHVTELMKRIKILNFEVSHGVGKGENMVCIVKAVKVAAIVDGKEKAYDFFAKCVPMNPLRARWVTEGNVFAAEEQVYKRLLPAWNKLLKNKTLSTARCHYTAADSVILMENLQTQGYKMVPKKEGITDVGHGEMLLKNLALLHACSYHFVQTYPGGLTALKKDFELFFHETFMPIAKEEDRKQFEFFLMRMLATAGDIVEMHDAELGKRTKKYFANGAEKLNEIGKPQGDFNLIIHGDCWSNNFMFLYDDDGKLTNMKIVDLQIMRYTRPSLDLVYFFCTSTSPEFRAEHLERLLRLYYKEFVSQLIEFGYPQLFTLFTFHDFRKQFDDCFGVGFLMGSFVAQAIMTEAVTQEGGALNMENITSEDEVKEKMDSYKEDFMKTINSNKDLQNRLLGMANEAAALGII